MTSQPLSIHPWPISDRRLTLLKAAKAALNSPLKIVPVQAVPAGPGRVLAFGEVPPHVCRYAYIRPENVDSVGSIAAALRFILDEDSANPDPRWTEAAWLSQVMGGEVRYSHSETRDGQVFYG